MFDDPTQPDPQQQGGGMSWLQGAPSLDQTIFGQLQPGNTSQAQSQQQAQGGFNWQDIFKQAGKGFSSGYKGQSLEDQQAQAHMQSLQSNPLGQNLAKMIKKLFPKAGAANDLDKNPTTSSGSGDSTSIWD